VRRGQIRPFRQRPRDFEERWPSIGWTAAELEWNAHARTIARWVDECGRDRMVLARKRWLDARREEARRQAKRGYVLGGPLPPMEGKPVVIHLSGTIMASARLAAFLAAHQRAAANPG
jgi:hypothetical protein